MPVELADAPGLAEMLDADVAVSRPTTAPSLANVAGCLAANRLGEGNHEEHRENDLGDDFGIEPHHGELPPIEAKNITSGFAASIGAGPATLTGSEWLALTVSKSLADMR